MINDIDIFTKFQFPCKNQLRQAITDISHYNIIMLHIFYVYI